MLEEEKQVYFLGLFSGRVDPSFFAFISGTEAWALFLSVVRKKGNFALVASHSFVALHIVWRPFFRVFPVNRGYTVLRNRNKWVERDVGDISKSYHNHIT